MSNDIEPAFWDRDAYGRRTTRVLHAHALGCIELDKMIVY